MVKKQITKYLIIIGVSLIISACSTSSKNITVSEKDQGNTIEVKQNETLTIELEGNPTTGYTWEIAPDSTPILQQIDDAEFKSDNDAIGSAGTIIIKLKASTQGEGTLKLVYHRPWETDIPPEETFYIKVIVR